jgi:hypothetical protein
MPRQLNIRSDEAYRIAHWLAKRRRQAIAEVATEALRSLQSKTPRSHEPTPQETAETFRFLMEASERCARAAKPGSSSDHSCYLSDEHGLPK